MGINFNPRLRKNDSLDISEVYSHASKNKDVRSGDIEKALRTSGVDPALSRATAQSLKQDPDSPKSDALFNACVEDCWD